MTLVRFPRRFEVDAVAVALLTGLFLAAPPASAHLPGAAPLTQSGSTTLAPWGSPNYTIHAFMDQIGLPPSVGDTLQIEFAVDNGTGPPVLFEIHTHAGPLGYKVYYNKSLAALKDTWKVPENASYMIYFENPYNFSVFLTYSFVLLAPPPDTGILLFIFAAIAGIALGWFFFVRAGLRPAAEEDGEDAEDEHEDSPAAGEDENAPPEAPTPDLSPPPGR